MVNLNVSSSQIFPLCFQTAIVTLNMTRLNFVGGVVVVIAVRILDTE